eukprot:1844373-Rhodomonas_salina.5
MSGRYLTRTRTMSWDIDHLLKQAACQTSDASSGWLAVKQLGRILKQFDNTMGSMLLFFYGIGMTQGMVRDVQGGPDIGTTPTCDDLILLQESCGVVCGAPTGQYEPTSVLSDAQYFSSIGYCGMACIAMPGIDAACHRV